MLSFKLVPATVLVLLLALVLCDVQYFVKFDETNNGGLRNGVPGSDCNPWRYNATQKSWNICFKSTSNPQCYLERPQFAIRHNHPKILVINVAAKLNRCEKRNTTLCSLTKQSVSVDLVIYYKHGLNPRTYTWRILKKSGGEDIVYQEQKIVHTEIPALINAIYFRISPIEFCGFVTNVTIFSYVCPATIKDMVIYPEVSADPINMHVDGRCVENAIPALSDPFAKCSNESGVYRDFTGSCVCKDGYTLRNNSCQVCSITKYKVVKGNHACTNCGANSFNNGTLELCQCKLEYYRRYEELGQLQKDCHHARSFGLCPKETILRETGELYLFSETQIGKSANVTCIFGITEEARAKSLSSTITRNCFIGADNKPKWEDVDLDVCGELILTTVKSLNEVEVSDETVVSVSSVLTDITANATAITTGVDINDITKIMDKCLDVDGKNQKVTTNILKSINNILLVNKTVMAQSSQEATDGVLKILDKVAEKNIETPLSFSDNNFGFAVTKADTSHDLYTDVVSPEDGGGSVKIKFSSRQDRTKKIPAGLFIPRSVFVEKRVEFAAVYAYTFKEDSFFLAGQQQHGKPTKNQTMDVANVGSYILSATVFNTSVSDLKTPIELSFVVQNGNDPAKARCSYWETNDEDMKVTEKQVSHWSIRGCYKSGASSYGNETIITCKCSHLTNFAVLFNVYDEPEDVLKSDPVLNLVSLIGCTLSIFCLIATLVCYLGLREIRKRTVRKIIINFCFSLLFLLVTFVFGVDVVHPQWACHLVATLIHLFTLSTFLWMGVQAVFLYKKAVRATKNRGQSKKTYKVSFVISWGLPVLVAGSTCPFTMSQFYGDDVTQTFCVMRGTPFFYATLLPVCVILLSNFTLFLPVIRKIQLHIATRSIHQSSINALWRRMKVTLSCTTLLGLTWVFAFFAIDSVRIPFQWLFCITNSLQGLCLFIFHVTLNTKVTRAWKKIFLKHSSTNNPSSLENSSRSQAQWRLKSDKRTTLRRESQT